jgi:hypothetical protein
MPVNIGVYDEQILNAIKRAGLCQYQYGLRKGVRPKPGDRNQMCWVAPREIGYVYTQLLLRLRRLTEYGLLECRYVSGRPLFRMPQRFRFS